MLRGVKKDPFFFMKNLIPIVGLGAAALYLLSRSRQEEAQKELQLPTDYNPDVRITLTKVEYRNTSVKIFLTFSVNFPGKFKNERFSAMVYRGNEFIKSTFDGKNWSVRGAGFSDVKYDIIFGQEIWKYPNILDLVQRRSFWEQFRIKGDFKSRERSGERIAFNNPIIVSDSVVTEFQQI